MARRVEEGDPALHGRARRPLRERAGVGHVGMRRERKHVPGAAQREDARERGRVATRGTETILLVDDNPDDRTLVAHEIRRELPDVAVEQVWDADGLGSALAAAAPLLVITDYQLRWADGLRVLAEVKARYPDCPVVMFTGTGSEEIAVAAMKAGLDDYVIKSPTHFRRLPAAIRLALDRAEERRWAKEAEARYRSLFGGVPIGLFRCSPGGEVLDANPAMLEMLGQRGPGFSLRIEASDVEGADVGGCWQDAQDAGGFVREREGCIRRADGSVLWVRLNARAVRDPDHRVLHYEGSLEDVTQIKHYTKQVEEARARAEEQARVLQQQAIELVRTRDQALASTRAKSHFLANVSHELRTPMNGIFGMVDLMLDGSLSPEQEDFARTIQRCSESLLTIINDILDASRIESGKMAIEVADFDLRDVVEEVAALLAPTAHEKGLEFTCRISPEMPHLVQGDAGRVRQIVTNLVGNAIKFTHEGEVAIAASALRHTSAHVTVRLAVRDTGIGIPAHQHAAIFESFTQADGSSTRRYGGTGLGLTITRQLTELMDGAMGLESEPGAGSTFWVDLSFQTQRRAPKRPSLEVLAGQRVLVADAHMSSRLILAEQLQAWGLRVTQASGYEEMAAALREAADADPFRVVLLDQDLPGMEGEDPHPMDVPALLLTRRRGSRALPSLAKPVRQEHLLAALLDRLGYDAERARAERAGVAGDLGLHVLVVEDDPVNRKVMLRIVEKWRCRADTATNGREALAAVAHGLYDVVIMDIAMPEMDGFEAAREIRRREAAEGRRAYIIALTAHALAGDRERCLAAGMDDYITKPVEPAELRRLLERRRDRAPA
jgi:PAS domain S-box-containing protein